MTCERSAILIQYALLLRDGTIIEFEGAAPPSAGWILLHRPKIVNRGYDACSRKSSLNIVIFGSLLYILYTILDLL